MNAPPATGADGGASVHLGEATWVEVTGPVGGGPPLLAVPIGSCEQHGPHLPIDTDTRIAIAVATGLARSRPGILVAPALTISASGEHRGFAGTLSLGTEATILVLVELVRSADWSAGVVFVNGHGGNFEANRAALQILADEGRPVIDWWPTIAGGDAHAGRTETSLMLAIAPHLVRQAAAQPGNVEPLATLRARLGDGGIASVSANGVLGDPTDASADDGRRLLAALISDLVERVAEWRG